MGTRTALEAALIAALQPFADLLEEQHPAGTVFKLDVEADDVARAKALLLTLEEEA